MKGVVVLRRAYLIGWTTQKFPFNVKTAHTLKIREQHVVTVTGKAFYDIAHAPADHSNRRRTPKDYAVWEIHPVMNMEVLRFCSSITMSRVRAVSQSGGLERLFTFRRLPDV